MTDSNQMPLEIIANLYGINGAFIGSIQMPELIVLPTAIEWSERIFVWIGLRRGVNAYQEVIAYEVPNGTAPTQ